LLSDYDTGLLARKSKRVSIMIYEQVNSEHDGTSFVQEIQPCMQFYDEDFTAFENGHYTITVDGSKNTDNFKEEIEMRKKYNGYGSGVF
jgi:pyruvate/2-oxoacid:ferredoxin oxidoreductase beta subunit